MSIFVPNPRTRLSNSYTLDLGERTEIDASYFEQVDRACSTVKTVSGPPKVVRLST